MNFIPAHMINSFAQAAMPVASTVVVRVIRVFDGPKGAKSNSSTIELTHGLK